MNVEDTVPNHGTAASAHRPTQPLVRDTARARADGLFNLGLPQRAHNALIRHGILTISDLLSRSRQQLKHDVPGLGTGTIEVIEKILNAAGLQLAVETYTARRFHPYGKLQNRHVQNHNSWLKT